MKTQEQSSILTPNNDLIGVKKSKEVTHESQKLPQPTGILMGQDTLERQQVASQCANVLAVGPHAYQDKKRFPDGPWCKVGDWIMFARYAGSRIKIEGGEVRLLNDDEVLATIENPEDILHEY